MLRFRVEVQGCGGQSTEGVAWDRELEVGNAERVGEKAELRGGQVALKQEKTALLSGFLANLHLPLLGQQVAHLSTLRCRMLRQLLGA